MAAIGDYELLDHGIEHSDYFQGCGTAFTSFEHVATGIGDNFAEAYDDACEMIAQQHDIDDWEAFDKRVLADNDAAAFPTSPAVEHDEDEGDMGSVYYHVSIRYNLAE